MYVELTPLSIEGGIEFISQLSKRENIVNSIMVVPHPIILVCKETLVIDQFVSIISEYIHTKVYFVNITQDI